MASAFNVGDLVWAKMKGFPPWPGLVSDPPDPKKLNEKKPKFYIFFFGSENYAWVTFDNMCSYLDKREEYLAMLRPTHSFQEAVDAIDDYVRENGGYIPEAPKKSPQKLSDNEEEKTASGRRSRKRLSKVVVVETPSKIKVENKPKSVKKESKKLEDKKEIKENVRIESEKKEKSKNEVIKKEELKSKKLSGDDDDEDEEDDGVELKSKRISRKRNDDEEEDDEDEDIMEGVIEGGSEECVAKALGKEKLKEKRVSEDDDDVDGKNDEDESVEKMLVGEDKIKKMEDSKEDADADVSGSEANDNTNKDVIEKDLKKEEFNKSSKKEITGKFDPRESAKKPSKPQNTNVKSPSNQASTIIKIQTTPTKTSTPTSKNLTTRTPTTTSKNPTTAAKTPTTAAKTPTTAAKTPTTATKTPSTVASKTTTSTPKVNTPSISTKTPNATSTAKVKGKDEGGLKKKENGVAVKRKITLSDKKTDSNKKATYLPDVLSSTTEPASSNKATPKLNKKFSTITPTKKKIGFIGCGNVGSRLVANLLASRHHVYLWNRTASKCKDLLKKGAIKCSSASDMVRKADIIITCVSDAVAFRDVVYGADGVLQEMREGKGFVNLTTVDVETNLDAYEAVTSRDGLYLEAAMLGSLDSASKGDLLVLVSGDQVLYEQCTSFFKAISKDIFNLVDIGTATKMQVVFNSLYGTTLAGLAEGLSLASKVGIDPAEVLEVVSHTSVVSQLIRTKGEAMVKNKVNDIDIKLDTLQRHIRLAINMSEEVDQPLHVGSVVNELFKKAKAKGYGDCDVSAVYRATDL